MTKYFVTQVFATEGVRSVTETPITVSPSFTNLGRAQHEALKLSGVQEEDADWWFSGINRALCELHRPNGTWTGFAVRMAGTGNK